MPSAIEDEEEGTQKNGPYELKKIDALYNAIPELKNLFRLHKEVGEGTFSTVYLATLRHGCNRRQFAIKHIVPTCHPQRIKLELKCLKTIGGKNNVAGIDLCLRNMNNVVFIMPYLHHDSFHDYYDKMDADELQFYIKNLLIAVAHIHQFGIIHRDIKPSNFLYNRKNRQFLLVDFGLAQMQEVEEKQRTKRKRESDQEDALPHVKRRQLLISPPKKKNNSDQENVPTNKKITGKECVDVVMFETNIDKKKKPARPNKYCNCYGRSITCTTCLTKKPLVASRAGTPGFRPPEVLLKVTNQSTAVDVWAVGVILLSLLSHTSTFFTSPDDVTALAELMTIFGTERLKRVAHLFNRHLITSECLPGIGLKELCDKLRSRSTNGSSETVYPSSVYDLLEKLLQLNPDKRITAERALEEPFVRRAS